MQLRILDICSGAGLAAIGYHQAGWDVVGVDIAPQPRYPFRHICQDALEYLADIEYIRQNFDAIHASPPCQLYSLSTAPQRAQGKQYPDLVSPIRVAIEQIGLPWVIENVPNAPIRADIMLYGHMFGLNVIRWRHFETGNWYAMQPGVPQRVGTVNSGDYISVYGKGGYRKSTDMPRGWRPKFDQGSVLRTWHYAMGIPKEYEFRDVEIAEGIPPAYTRYIGEMLAHYIHHTTTTRHSTPPSIRGRW